MDHPHVRQLSFREWRKWVLGFGYVCLRDYWRFPMSPWVANVAFDKFRSAATLVTYSVGASTDLKYSHNTSPRIPGQSPRLLFAFDVAWLQIRVQQSKLYKKLKHCIPGNVRPSKIQNTLYAGINVYLVEPFVSGLGFYKLFQLPTNMIYYILL